jgi:phytoene synthase
VSRKTSFYYSFLVLPSEQRRAIIAVWDFCRAVDDAVDLEPDPARSRAALAGWRAEIALVYDGGVPATPEGRQLQPFARGIPLPREQFEALVDGVSMDVSPGRFRTFDELEPYCHRVASSVGLICAKVFGAAGVDAYARDLGVALQLTNILRDVAVDYRRGRLYIPIEDLQRFGCSEDDVARQVHQPKSPPADPLRHVLEHQAARARLFFDRAARALPREGAGRLIAAEIMRAIYRDLLLRIEAARCDVFASIIRVPRPAQARLAIRTWLALRRRT